MRLKWRPEWAEVLGVVLTEQPDKALASPEISRTVEEESR
jgi:hypothetical protein